MSSGKNSNDLCCGCGSSDVLNINKGADPGHIESIFMISGMDCSDEVNAITRALSIEGISNVSASLVSTTVSVRHDPIVRYDRIKKLIEKSGVRVVEKKQEGFISENRHRIVLVVSSGVFLGIGLLADWAEVLPEFGMLTIFLVATLLAGSLVFPKAIRSLKQFALDMNVLMSVAVIGAFLIREYSEAATVVFLFSLAELLEAFSVARARQAIKEVLKLTPQMAHRKVDGIITDVPVVDVSPTEILIVRPGESIPLDGTVIGGTSAVNQAPLTGESRLIDKSLGDPVFAGTINENGSLTVQVTQAFKDTKISRIIRLIEEAQNQKAPAERFVDSFAKVYTPIVLVLAIFVCIIPTVFLGQSFDLWFYRALVLLVIACPCALVIATPVSVVSGLASLAKRGVLVKGGTFLESLGKIQAVALDKTGTLTEGKFKVRTLKLFGVEELTFLKLASTLESVSSHPLAQAVVEYAADRGISPDEVKNYLAVPGRGAEAWIGEHLYFLGNHRFAHELGVCTPDLEKYLSELEADALSVVIIGLKPHDGHKGEVLGVFGMGDVIRYNAKQAIAHLHQVGVRRVVVLSGDNQRTLERIKTLTGIDRGLGDLLPEDKVREVKALTKEFGEVAMVGDGVNDAPALAHATLGISMGAAGTDTAIETSDIALMQDNLEELPKAIQQGRRVLSVIRFNIGFALLTKAVFLSLAVFGYSNLWLAVLADMGASLLVTFNALRLLQSDPP